MDYLDEPILIEILARVPVKSLLRFKCVSRQWRDLISDPGFVKTQLRISLRDNRNPPQRLVLEYGGVSTRNHVSLNIADVAAEGGELEDAAFTRLDPGPVDPRVVASCHGLVCLLADEARMPRFFLYNPTTREKRKLPAALSHNRFSSVCVVGLGYDAPNDDYKLIVGTRSLLGGLRISMPAMFDIFSLRSNSWRRIGEVIYRIQGIDGKYSNGFLHWPLDSASMLSFDVTKEEFHKGLLPMPSFTEHEGGTRLGVTGGGWLIAQRISLRNTTEVLIMKGYCGPDSTWTKLCYLPEQPWSHNDMFPWIRDGKIILCALLEDARIAIHDPEDDSQVAIQVPTAYAGHLSIITSYVESLVSPHV